jgi:D-alanine-D-alanine ligase
MQSRKIGVLLGGLSSEREVSLRTGEAVLAALRDRGHDAVPIYVDRDVDVALRQERIEVAFIALHGRWGEDGSIQGMLEMLGIPYTGSDVLASALAMHKGKAKELFRMHNLPTPAYYCSTATTSTTCPATATRFPWPSGWSARARSASSCSRRGAGPAAERDVLRRPPLSSASSTARRSR